MLSGSSTVKRRWLAILFLALVPIVPLWRAVFLGEAIGPFDQIRQMAPWDGPKPYQPWDVLQADAVLQFYPWRDLVLDSWSKGQLPFWNNYELAGTPLMANSQSAGLYPPLVVLGVLHVPTALAITLLAWLHLAWAGIGVYALARRLGANRLAAVVAGASFSLSPFMLAWVPLSSVIFTVAWIPWVLRFVLDLFPGDGREVVASGGSRAGKNHHGGSGDAGRTTTNLAGATAMMLLAGHLQFAAYGLMAATIVIVMSVLAQSSKDTKPIQPLLLAILGLLIGGMIAMPQLLPALEYGKFSHRKNTPTQEGYDAYVALAVKPFELSTLGFPNALGSPRAPVDVDGRNLPEYWPPLVKPGATFADSAIGLGPLILCGIALVPWKRRTTWAMAALASIALLMAMGTVIDKALYFAVPGWSATGSPGRIEVLFVLAACLLTAIGLSHLEEDFKLKRIWAPLLLLAEGVSLAFFGVKMAPAATSGADAVEQLQAIARASAVPGIAIAALLTLLGLAVISVPALKRYRLALAVMPVLLAWVLYGSDIVMTGKPLGPFSVVPGNQRVAFINQNWGMYTALKGSVMPANTASLSRIHELGGYDSLLHKDTVEFLKKVDGADPAPPANGNMMFIKPSATPEMLAEAGVSSVYRTTVASGDAVLQAPEAIPGPGRFSMANGSVESTSEGYDRLEVHVKGGPGELAVRDRMMPGWTATIDGTPAPIAPGLWRMVVVPTAGEHTVLFRYSPPGFKNGVLLAVVGFALLAAMLVTGRRKSRG